MGLRQVLVDHDVSDLERMFPGWKGLQHYELRTDTADKDIVTYACANGLTIVTANGPDFQAAIRTHIKLTKKSECFRLFGLIVVPNQAAVRTSALKDFYRKLKALGYSLAKVNNNNLLVKVMVNGRVTVSEPFKRCPHCTHYD